MRSKEKNWNLRTLLSVIGFIFELIRVVVHGLEKRNGTIGHLRRLIKEPKLADRVFDLIIEQPVREQPVRVWKTWKTITHSVGRKDADGFRIVLVQVGRRISDWANNLLNTVVFSKYIATTTVPLVVVTNAELGFASGATFRETCDKGREMGLDLCLPEDGPELRRKYINQPKGEWLILAMEPTDTGSYLKVWSVGCDDDGLWLSSDDGSPDSRQSADVRFVFRRRK